MNKDKTQLAKDLEKVFAKYYDLNAKAALAIAFTLPPNYDEVHWVTNVNRIDGITLFEETAKKMKSQLN